MITPKQRSILDSYVTRFAGTPAALMSIWFGPLSGPPSGPAWYARNADVPHNAASTMKVAVLAALYRCVDAGQLDLAASVVVHNSFRSALTGAPRFGCDRIEDSDPQVWDRLGSPVPLGWLAERMIVKSGNLATNLVLEQLPPGAVAQVWRIIGATSSTTLRGIDDAAARSAGLNNAVTAGDLSRLLSVIVLGARGVGLDGGLRYGQTPLASTSACTAMHSILLRQECRDDLALGLPDGTPIAHKNGWITGIRHCTGVIQPPDGPPYALTVCTTDPRRADSDDAATCRLLGEISAACWRARLVQDSPS